MPGRWSKPEWDNLALVMPSPTAKKGSFKVYPKLAGQEACLLTYWVENKQMEPQESATRGKSRAKQDEKYQQQLKKKRRNVRSHENAPNNPFGQNK